MSDVLELKPHRPIFVLQRVLPAAIALVALHGAIAAAVVVGEGPPLVAFLPGVVVVGGVWLSTRLAGIAYRKERYVFCERRLIAHRGSLTTDQSTELVVRNVTHVKRRLPWLRFLFFRVGDVVIESAGSEAAEITLRSIENPDQVYHQVAEVLKASGFRLGRRELLHEEKPDLIGVLLECLGLAGGSAMVLFFTVGEIAVSIGFDLADPALAIALGLLGTAVPVVAFLLRFLDLRRRTYRVYDDAIVYEEGFLTRDDAFIPAENIADSNTRRSLFDRILGLYDVQISCQGSRSEIRFRRLRHGPQLDAAVDRVIERFGGGVPVETVQPVETTGPDDLPTLPAAPRPGQGYEPVALDRAWTAELRPSVRRAVMPWLILSVVAFPLVFLWVPALVGRLIAALCTRYEIRPRSVRSLFRFLHTIDRDFSYDKITGIVVRDGPLDRRLGTVSISLWSIGSSQPLDLLHVPIADLDLGAFLRQAGIPEDAPIREIPSRFGIFRHLRGAATRISLVALVVLAIVGTSVRIDDRSLHLGLALLALCWLAVIAWAFVHYGRCGATVHEGHVEAWRGILWRHRFRSRHDSIKRLELTTYPLGDVGTVRFHVAGERRLQPKGARENPGAGSPILPYGFGVHYAESMAELSTALDAEIGGEPDRPGEPPAVVLESRPALANRLFVLVAGSVLTVVLVAFLPILLPLNIVEVRRRRYRVERDRVVFLWGIVYRHQTSIRFDRIDSLQRGQRLLNKMFGNGSVILFTAGSSRPDLVLADAVDHDALYAAIQARYAD